MDAVVKVIPTAAGRRLRRTQSATSMNREAAEDLALTIAYELDKTIVRPEASTGRLSGALLDRRCMKWTQRSFSWGNTQFLSKAVPYWRAVNYGMPAGWSTINQRGLRGYWIGQTFIQSNKGRLWYMKEPIKPHNYVERGFNRFDFQGHGRKIARAYVLEAQPFKLR